eukprot:TRINITY_DN3713_c0_g1_i1.p1 TRINITY_DN3713_c0_g1~~TRINITY_DN3713_c0_g1_i1.p1  ORF type:complete len:519 (+),score=128.96 TRINITY_DN3713_c0_g1_i1:65-1558(+)
MRTVLMVAEKPMLADAISKALSHGQAVKRHGLSRACPVFEYTGKFRGQPARFKFTCTVGHVYSINFTAQYQDWQKVDEDQLFFEARTVKEEASEGARVPAHLKKEAQGCTDIVLWLDCDREGENICFEVLSSVMDSIRDWEHVWRAKFSAITPQELQHAMDHLGRPDQNISDSVDARQELDLRVGVAFSRFQTKYFQGRYGNLDTSVVSYGPCQTPTLGFCVDRHDQIQNFKPEAFWRLVPHVQKGGRYMQFDWERGRVFDRAIANLLWEQCNATKARVNSVQTKRDVRSRPGALNTVELLKIASKSLGMGAQHTMRVAESLYQSGFISYPRTESTAYPATFDFKGPLQDQRGNSSWGPFVQQLLQQGYTRPKGGKDMGDHPPITPMRAATQGQLGGDDWRLYEYITRHYIATLSPDMHFMRTKVVIQMGPETFTATGRVAERDQFCWVQVLPHFRLEDEALPDVSQGEMLEVSRLELYEGQTSPPDYLTEAVFPRT